MSTQKRGKRKLSSGARRSEGSARCCIERSDSGRKKNGSARGKEREPTKSNAPGGGLAAFGIGEKLDYRVFLAMIEQRATA